MNPTSKFGLLTQEACVEGAKLVNQNVSHNLICSVCRGVFHEPIKASCGHTFCEKCVVIYQDATKTARVILNKCPICGKAFNYQRFQRDILAFSLINDLEVYCQGEQCQWRGHYTSYAKHKLQCQHWAKMHREPTVLPQDEDIKQIKQQLREASKEDQIKNKRLLQEFQDQSREANKEWEALTAAKLDPASKLTLQQLVVRYPDPRKFMNKYPAYIFSQIEKFEATSPELLDQIAHSLNTKADKDIVSSRNQEMKEMTGGLDSSKANRNPKKGQNREGRQTVEDSSRKQSQQPAPKELRSRRR